MYVSYYYNGRTRDMAIVLHGYLRHYYAIYVAAKWPCIPFLLKLYHNCSPVAVRIARSTATPKFLHPSVSNIACCNVTRNVAVVCYFSPIIPNLVKVKCSVHRRVGGTGRSSGCNQGRRNPGCECVGGGRRCRTRGQSRQLGVGFRTTILVGPSKQDGLDSIKALSCPIDYFR